MIPRGQIYSYPSPCCLMGQRFGVFAIEQKPYFSDQGTRDRSGSLSSILLIVLIR